MRENIFKKREREKKYYSLNKEKFKIAHAKWYFKNKEKINERNNKNNQKRRKIALEYYGGNPPKCACCGEKEIKFLSIDHINGGGNQQRKNGICNLANWLIKNNFPKGFQVLCYNCNMAKAFFINCPHKNKMV